MEQVQRHFWKDLVESRWFQHTIIGLILINAVILGLETSPEVMAQFGSALLWADQIILGIFVVELLIRAAVYRGQFLRDPWSIFDTVVVAVALAPSGGAFSVVRALRVLRVLRLVSVVPSMRRVVEALLASLPGMSAIMALLGLIFYVAAVIATKLFSQTFPLWFGDLGDSFFTLFQIMTLESWAMGIVRPVLETHPSAWVFFVLFILIATFTMLNLFIAVVVNALQSTHEKAQGMSDKAAIELGHSERDLLMHELRSLRTEVTALRTELRAETG